MARHSVFRRFLIAPLGCLAIFISQSASAQQLLEVESYVWTNAVDRTTRTFDKKASVPIRGTKAYLWMQLKGSQALFSRLKSSEDGRLPIRHLWYRYFSDRVAADLDVAVDLNIGTKDDLKRISYELDALGFFRWRVWSGKEHLSPGLWRVDLVYEDDSAVVCEEAGDGKPCSFLLEVKP